MTTTANFGFPLLYPNQAQKDVVVNSTFTEIDSVIQLNVLDTVLNLAPTSPTDQDKYIVGASPTGVWAGKANNIAIYQSNGSNWLFLAPKTGWVAYSVANGTLLVWSGTAWVALATTFANANIATLAALPSIASLVDIAGLTPTNNILIQGNGTHFVAVTPNQAFGALGIMYALIFGG